VQSWPGSPVPSLPGTGYPARVHDTATGRVQPLTPGRQARMYVCGITPYDATHLGHAFTYTTFDLLHRAWLDEGREVVYVQNITDIDDPLLERAVATGEDWKELAARETALFGADMQALRVLPPQHYIGAVESMELVVAAVQQLQQRGAAYLVDDDIYFSVASDPRFGGVASLDEPQMRTLCAERGGDPQRPGKQHPLDPLLWQAARPDEPAWDTALGHGRPGWHVECTSIALELLGMAFDVQGGGRDLAFPHHEMCAALGQVVTGEWPFARRYVHVGMVGLDGEKMSKSRGNLVFVSQLRRDGVPPGAIRLALHAHHYRADWEWTPRDLDAALSRRQRWQQAVAAPTGPAADAVLHEVRRALADDLDTPWALDVVDRWAEQVRRGAGGDPGAPGLVGRVVDALLGVDLSPDGPVADASGNARTLQR
jgi:L-cysteine:1D-myo-inositol 2-amino-2-deoxy-alpha-D-glucopyranoside ligase